MTDHSTGSGQDLRASINLGNWMHHPHGKFSFLHAAEFVPSAVIMPRRIGGARPSETGRLAAASVRIEDGSDVAATDMIARMEVDSLLVSRAGEIIVEHHAPHVDPTLPHLLFSVSKSLTALLAGAIVGDGTLAVADRVAKFVPELAGSGFGSATVRDLLDMTVDLAFNEDYEDPESDFNRYRRAVGWDEHTGRRETMLEVLASVAQGQCGHGQVFSYISAVTDVLGIVLERASGCRYVDLLRDRLLDPVGCSDLVTVAVDNAGHARATGGISMTAHDLLRIGRLVARSGATAEGLQVVPASWIDDFANGVSQQAWQRGAYADMLPEGHYRSCWYDVRGGRGPLVALGIFGQFLWVDRARDIVIACQSSRPVMSDAALSRQGIDVLAQLADQFA